MQELNLQLTTLKNASTALGYKPKIVKNHITKAMSIPQEALLKYQIKSKSDHIPLIQGCPTFFHNGPNYKVKYIQQAAKLNV